jgi:beta-lactamase regulating signal transducer with metallopeptidase domain
MDMLPSLVLAATIKAAAILGLAGLVTLAWRSASASTRHLVWSVAVVSALILPIAGVALALSGGPRISIPVWNPVVTVTADIAPVEDNVTPAVTTNSPALSEPVFATTQPHEASTTSSISISESSIPEEPVIDASPSDVNVAPIESPVTAEIELGALAAMIAPSIVQPLFDNWQRSAVFIWAAGALLALLPLLLALIKVRMMSRRATLLSDSRWLRLIETTPAISHLAPQVRVLESDEASMPMTWGILRPTLLMPSSAERWSDWQCRNILLHELAHVERRDCLTQLIAHITCAVYWFNPLAWVAAHRMRVERELACDDCVISAGSVASDYAENLLEVARSLRAPAFTSHTAIAMARPSQLSGRLLAVLDARRNRQGVSRRAFTAASFAAVAVVLPLASVMPRSAIAASSEAPSSHVPVVVDDMGTASAPATSSAAFSPTPLAIVRAAQIPAPTIVPSAVSIIPPAIASVFSAKPAEISAPAAPASALVGQQSRVCWAQPGGKTNTSISNRDDDSRQSWNVRYTRDGCTLELRAEGKFTLRPDLTDIESIASDGWFRVEETNGRNSKRIEIRQASGGGLEHKYWVNGDRATFDNEARAWLGETLLAVERRTAFAADSRVPRLYRSGGLRAVLAEIGYMDAAYAKSRYYGTLLGMDVSLDTNTLNEVVRHASNDLTSSDYYMAEVLGKLASQKSANEGTWRLFAEAAGKMKSDYYSSTILKKVLASGRLSNETVGVLLRSASKLESDYYLYEVLKSVAGKYALNDATRSFYTDALSSIGSDHYRMELLKSMNTADAWDARTTTFVLNAVSGIKSDYYKSESLVALVKNRHVNNWPAFFNAAVSMDSDHYKRETLNAALRHTPLTREIVAGVISVTPRIKSDYAKAEVLGNVARTFRLDADLQAAYEKVADDIDSDHYRGAALAALRRSAAR